MSDQVPTASAQAEMPQGAKKKFVNAITQHGSESTADEENIVVLVAIRSGRSPNRECDDPVQHEEFEYNDFVAGDASDVSTKTFFLSGVIFYYRAMRISSCEMYRISNYITTQRTFFPRW